jgi:hypothetical protein
VSLIGEKALDPLPMEEGRRTPYKVLIAEVALGRGCRPLPAPQVLFYTKLRRNVFKPRQPSLLLGEACGGPAQQTHGLDLRCFR